MDADCLAMHGAMASATMYDVNMLNQINAVPAQ